MKKTSMILLSTLALAGAKPPCNPPMPPYNVSVFVDSFADQIPHAVIVWQLLPPKTKVVIERADGYGSGFGGWQAIATIPPSASSYVDYQIAFGVPYLYQVKSVNNCGETVSGPLFFEYCGGGNCGP